MEAQMSTVPICLRDEAGQNDDRQSLDAGSWLTPKVALYNEMEPYDRRLRNTFSACFVMTEPVSSSTSTNIQAVVLCTYVGFHGSMNIDSGPGYWNVCYFGCIPVFRRKPLIPSSVQRCRRPTVYTDVFRCSNFLWLTTTVYISSLFVAYLCTVMKQDWKALIFLTVGSLVFCKDS